MTRSSQNTGGWPTVLWIGWRAGEVEHQEPLCLAHRAHVFEHFPASAYGLKRRGERCSMCVAHPPQAAESRGRGTRGSGRRVSPTRHDPSYRSRPG